MCPQQGSPDGILTRFTALVNHLCFNQSGTVLAAGSRLVLMSMFNRSECQLFDCSLLDYKSATTGNPVLNLEIVQYNLKVHCTVWLAMKALMSRN